MSRAIDKIFQTIEKKNKMVTKIANIENTPYRTNTLPKQIKLPRFKARLRRLYRRVILPSKIIGILLGINSAIFLLFYNSNLDERNNNIAKTELNLKMEKDIADKQTKLNYQQTEINNKSIALAQITNNPVTKTIPKTVQGMYFENSITGYGNTIVRMRDLDNNRLCYVSNFAITCEKINE